MNWPAMNPRKIVAECTPRHIQTVLEDAQSTIARLTAEKQELVLGLECAAARLDYCAAIIAQVSSASEALRVEQHTKAKSFASDARAALAKVQP